MMEMDIIAKSKKWASRYLGTHQDTARESFVAGAMAAGEEIIRLNTTLKQCYERIKKLEGVDNIGVVKQS